MKFSNLQVYYGYGFFYITFESLLLLLVVVTREIHLEDIFEALTRETLDAHQKVLEEELIHMLLLLVFKVFQMVQYTLDLTFPFCQTL